MKSTLKKQCTITEVPIQYKKVLFIGREILSDFDVCFNVFKYYGKF